jgi:hypothetical protein
LIGAETGIKAIAAVHSQCRGWVIRRNVRSNKPCLLTPISDREPDTRFMSTRPKLFEQIADLLSVKPTLWVLDLGSAGFRGFDDASDPMNRVRDLKFASGGHSTGIDIKNNEAKKNAIVSFAVDVDSSEALLEVFQNSHTQCWWLDKVSNLSWTVWLVLAELVFGLGELAFSLHFWVGIGFVLAVLLTLEIV